jgi:PAS domain S-box-containing protein
MEKEIQVLILEDDPAEAAQIDQHLQAAGLPFHSDRVETPDDFRSHLRKCAPDLIILDHGRPSFSHSDALKVAQEYCPEIPCISLLGPEGEQAVIEEFKRGATDCVLKDQLPVLVEAIQHAVDKAERQEGLKTAQRALKASEHEMRLFVQSVRDYAINMLDPEGRVISWNEGAERIEGYRAEEILGRHFSILFAPEEIAQGLPEQELHRAAVEGISRTTGWCMRKDGSKFWSDWSLTAVRGERGELQGFLKVAHDVTRQREAEQRIQALNNDLERRVRARTAQLEGSNRDLEAFSYSISHDLQAPLRHIRNFAQQLQKESEASLPAPSREYLDIILRSAETMTEMVGALLRFSRVGRFELLHQNVDLNQLLQHVRRELDLEVGRRRVKWVVHRLPEVKGDPLLLRQVLHNLLSNALKYTRKRKSARIEVRAKETDDQFIISFEDNGVGFDMEYAHKLFNVFQRLHSASEFEGTGIGLAIARRIIEKHGGRVWAEAKPDEGATFFFALPKTPPTNSQ